jgi:hypothetical protein
MSNRLRFTTILCAVLGVSGMLAACGDDDDAIPGDENGGSSSGSAGKAAGGAAGMAGGADTAGAGGRGDGGAEPAIGGAGADAGGAAGAGGAVGVGGAAGAGGGGAELEYACGASTLSEKFCSALKTVACDEPTQPTLCVECIPTRESDLELFADCPACLALHEASYQCAVDAYESGNAAAGIGCYDIADVNEVCGAKFEQAFACNEYKLSNNDVCPATWPMP